MLPLRDESIIKTGSKASPGMERRSKSGSRRIPDIIKPMSSAHVFESDDPRLKPICDKALAGRRLSAADALALYRSPDILAVGWMANAVRERMHGDNTYFNVNRHINPTNVCVAACRLCAFGRKKDAPGAYTMALEEAFV